MMHIKSDLSAIKQIPIIDVARRLGLTVVRTKSMCFTGHDKATPSLFFQKNVNLWKCFGACGKGGDGIQLVMEKEGLDFKSALTWFAQNFHVEAGTEYREKRRNVRAVKSKKIARAPEPEAQAEEEFVADSELYDWFIGNCGDVSCQKGIEYLGGHSISIESSKHFHVRELLNPEYALRKLVEKWGEQRVYKSGIALGPNGKPDRLIWGSTALLFPFYEQEEVVYIQGRMLEGKTKFLNLRGVPKPLFNTGRLSDIKAGQLVHICEGVPDAIALESHGLAAVGVLGATSFRTEWVDRFLKLRVVLLGDGDDGGASFVKTISKAFSDRGKAVLVKPLPEGMDVSDVLARKKRT